MALAYPIELRLSGRPVLVVGGGKVAARKVAGLCEAQAAVRVVSLSFTDELLARQDITRETRAYGDECLHGAQLVFGCTNDRSVNASIAADARQMGVWCSLADDPEGSDFHRPAVFRQGEITVSVSTGGASPSLAAALRDRLASHLRPEWGILLEEMARARRLLEDRVADPEVRRDILETLCTDCSLELLTARDRDAWRGWFERVTEYRLKGGSKASDGL